MEIDRFLTSLVILGSLLGMVYSLVIFTIFGAAIYGAFNSFRGFIIGFIAFSLSLYILLVASRPRYVKRYSSNIVYLGISSFLVTIPISYSYFIFPASLIIIPGFLLSRKSM